MKIPIPQHFKSLINKLIYVNLFRRVITYRIIIRVIIYVRSYHLLPLTFCDCDTSSTGHEYLLVSTITDLSLERVKF